MKRKIPQKNKIIKLRRIFNQRFLSTPWAYCVVERKNRLFREKNNLFFHFYTMYYFARKIALQEIIPEEVGLNIYQVLQKLQVQMSLGKWFGCSMRKPSLELMFSCYICDSETRLKPICTLHQIQSKAIYC